MHNYTQSSQYLRPLLETLENLRNRLSSDYVYAPIWITLNPLPPLQNTAFTPIPASNSNMFASEQSIFSNPTAHPQNNFVSQSVTPSQLFEPVNNATPHLTPRPAFTCREFIFSCIEQLKIQIDSARYDEDEDFSIRIPQFTQRINEWAASNVYSLLGYSSTLNAPYNNTNEPLNSSLFIPRIISIDVNALFEFKLLTETIQVYLRNHIKTPYTKENEQSAETLHKKITDLNTEIDSYIQSFHTQSFKAEELNKSLDTLSRVKTHIDNWDKTEADIHTHKLSIEKAVTDSQRDYDTISTLLTSSQTTSQLIDNEKTLFDTKKKNFDDEFNKLLKDCREAKKEGIANALSREFKKRSDRNFWLALIWFAILCGIAVFITWWSHDNFDLNKGWLNLISTELPCLILLWPAWVASRQLVSSLSLKEDYAFKAAASNAYSLYKEEVCNLDATLQSRLFDSVIHRFDEHPLRFVSKDSPATPIGEIICLLSRSDLKKVFELLDRLTPDQINALISSLQKSPESSQANQARSSSFTANGADHSEQTDGSRASEDDKRDSK